MPCLANDLFVYAPDLQLLRSVAAGQKHALSQAMERFYPLVLALAAHQWKSFTPALDHVEPVVRGLFQSLLSGELAPEEFARQAVQRIATQRQMADNPDAAASTALHSLHGAAKLVRRRAAVSAINHLPRPMLMALVLRYHAGWTTDAMVGAVAETPDGVQAALIDGHRAVVDAMRAEE